VVHKNGKRVNEWMHDWLRSVAVHCQQQPLNIMQTKVASGEKAVDADIERARRWAELDDEQTNDPCRPDNGAIGYCEHWQYANNRQACDGGLQE